MEFEKNIEINEMFQATISVKIQKETIREEYDALVLKYSKELALPGFRRGKVPVSILNAKYSKAILEDLRSDMIKNASEEVFQDMEQDKLPLFPEDVTFQPEGEFKLDSDWSFTIQYEVKPEVNIVKDEGFTLKVPSIYVSDEDIQKELETIQERNSSIKDRGDDEVVNEGDLVTVDYQVFDGDVKERDLKDYTFTQNKPSTKFLFEKDILGMKKGEMKEFVKNYGDDYEWPSLKGKTRRIIVTIKEIKEKNLPALDDELAQDVSAEYKTLEDLKQDIKNKLEKQAKRLASDEKKGALIVALAKENDVYIPESLILHTFSHEYDHMLRGYQGSAEELKAVRYSLYKEASPKLRLKLQGDFIIDALLKKNEIKVDDEGVQEFLKVLSDEADIPIDTLQSFLSEPEKKETIIRRAEETKLFDLLYAKSTCEEAEKLSLNAYIKKIGSFSE